MTYNELIDWTFGNQCVYLLNVMAQKIGMTYNEINMDFCHHSTSSVCLYVLLYFKT